MTEMLCVLVTGGARSGKSVLAEDIATRLAARHQATLLYVATAFAVDGEMTTRIDAHRARRGPEWETIEAGADLVSALRDTEEKGAVRLVDCLTLWLAAQDDYQNFQPNLQLLCDSLRDARAPIVLVTNELGQGIVPADRATRTFRDAHGAMNQAVADIADQVWMAVSGQPLRLKPNQGLEI